MSHVNASSTHNPYFRTAGQPAVCNTPVKKPEKKTVDVPGFSRSLDFMKDAKTRSAGTGSANETKSVSEQDIFAAVVHQKIGSRNPQALRKFETAFEAGLAEFSGKKDKVYLATDAALCGLIKDGLISRNDLSSLLRESFEKAQLDGNRTNLSSDPAVNSRTGNPLTFDELMAWLASNTDASAGEIASFPASRQARKPAGVQSAAPAKGSLKAGASGDFGPPSNTFLWKPVSDSNGKLAVLLPANMTGMASSVKILPPDGRTTLATGRFSGVGNGSRTHFRFDKAGAAFPNGSVVQITMKDGFTQNIQISNTGSRTEKKF